MTDWYYSTKKFADVCNSNPTVEYANEILAWVKATYPSLDWSKYDKDKNGYVDSLVILNLGVNNSDWIPTISYSGAINYRHTYFGDYAGTPTSPLANVFTTVGYHYFKDNASTLIHEFAHGFGIIDYYDVSYSGIDAVGKFDMQSANAGDWNAYSKTAVGWTDPTVVSGLESGKSVEIKIGSSALTDDVIIIPAKGKTYDGPFSEYIMIDLFTDDGVNKFDASKNGFELADTAGVRISHVNATMEKRTLTVDSKEYTIGTIHFANNYRADVRGRYNIEVIQAGGANTFTVPQSNDTMLSKDDLFYAGDSFDVAEYDEFFYNGLMDDDSEFGYVVEIVSIEKDASGNAVATIRVTAK